MTVPCFQRGRAVFLSVIIPLIAAHSLYAQFTLFRDSREIYNSQGYEKEPTSFGADFQETLKYVDDVGSSVGGTWTSTQSSRIDPNRGSIEASGSARVDNWTCCAATYSEATIVFHVTNTQYFTFAANCTAPPGAGNTRVNIRFTGTGLSPIVLNEIGIGSSSNNTIRTNGILLAGNPYSTYTITAHCRAVDENIPFSSWSFALNLSDTPIQPEKDLGCYCNSSSPSVGNPIRLSSGNMYEMVEDYSTAGTNPLDFTRYYNSLATPDTLATALGRNWRCTYDRYLRIYPTSITAERADGQTLIFTQFGDTWKSDGDIDLHLVPAGSSWTLINSNDDSETYDSTGRLVSTQSRNGYSQTMTYTAGRLSGVNDSFNRTLQFTYQSNRLVSLSTMDGLLVTYRYTSSGITPDQMDRLASVSFSMTPPEIRTYLYEDSRFPFALTGIVDENATRYASWNYDPYGRCLSSSLANGVDHITVSYNDFDGTRLVTNPSGLQSLYRFQRINGVPKLIQVNRLAAQGVPPAQMSYGYDTNGYINSITDWNNIITHLTNDSRAMPLAVAEAVATPQSRVTARSYETNFHLPSSIVASNRTTRFVYDSSGNQLSRTEIDTTSANSTHSFGKTRVWTNTYDSFGRRLTTVGPSFDGRTTNSFTYDASNNVATVTDGLGFVTRYPNYTPRGLPLMMIDPNGVTNLFSYDLRGRMLARIILSETGNSTNGFIYNAAGQLTSITLPNGAQHFFQYDAAHRLQSISNRFGECISYTRDTAGNITHQTVRSQAGKVVKNRQHVFDALGRLSMVVSGSGQTAGYGYDNNGNQTLAYYTSAESNAVRLLTYTIREFDALNRMNATYDLTDFENTFIQAKYDVQDNRNSITDSRALTTTFMYDGFGRVTRETSPDKGTTIYHLDAAGNRTNEVDSRGVVTLRTFDKLNRPTSVTFPGAPSENMVLSYDSTNGGNYGIGRLTRYKDETGVTDLKYDERGNVIAVSRSNKGTVFTTLYRYDLANTVTNIVYPSGRSVIYLRDALGRISDVVLRAEQEKPLVNDIEYLPFGPVFRLRYGNGLTRSNSYDLDYRLTGLTTRSESIQVQALAYTYSLDAANKITVITDSLAPGNTQVFAYDQAFRLSHASGSYGVEQFTYDAAGNRATHTINGVKHIYIHAEEANQLIGVTSSAKLRNFTYTPNGNVSGYERGDGTNFVLAYSSRNRYKSLSSGNATLATYSYNAIGERVSKSVSGSTTLFHYDLNHRLIAESRENAEFIREYVWVGDMPLAQIESDGSIYYIHPDHLNRPQKITDSGQTIVWESQSRPFDQRAIGFSLLPGRSTNNHFRIHVGGSSRYLSIVQTATNLASDNWVSLTTNAGPFTYTESNALSCISRFYRVVYVPLATGVTNNVRYPGQYYDDESGFNYNIRRDYDPSIGRYLQPDPIGLAGGINLFTYAFSDPNSFFDRLGLAVDLNLTPTDQRNRSLYEWAEKWSDKDYLDSFSIAGHGTPGTIYGPDNKAISFAKLVEMIKQSGWKPGQRIILIICYAGAGLNSLAARLAEELGVEVVAPDKDYWPKEGEVGKGGVYSRRDNAGRFVPNLSDAGDWWDFHPDGSRNIHGDGTGFDTF